MAKLFVTLALPPKDLTPGNPNLAVVRTMPSHRVSKRSSNAATSCRSHLSRFIADFGAPAMCPCLSCISLERECKVAADSGRCGECVSLGRHCDLAVSMAALVCVGEELQKIDVEEQKVTEMKREMKVRRDHLRKQRSVLRKRQAKMIETELCGIEEQEADELATQQASSSGVDFSSLDFSLPLHEPWSLEEPLWSLPLAAPDDGGENPAGSSST